MIINSNILDFLKITLNELATIIAEPCADGAIEFSVTDDYNDDFFDKYAEDKTAGKEYECILFKDELRIVSIDDNTNIIETVKWVGSSYLKVVGFLLMNSLDMNGNVTHKHIC